MSGGPTTVEVPPRSPRGRLPVITWGARDAAWALVAGFLLATLLPVLFVAPFFDDLNETGAKLAFQGLFELVLVGTVVGVASGWRFTDISAALARLGFRRFDRSAVWIAVKGYAAYFGLTLVLGLIVRPDQEDISKELGACGSSVAIAVLAVILLALVAPVVEEMFFRGMFFSGLRSRFSLWPAAAISGGLFGLAHAPTGPISAIVLIGLGVALATDGNARYSRLDPYAGTQLALAEACRNVAATGAIAGAHSVPAVRWGFLTGDPTKFRPAQGRETPTPLNATYSGRPWVPPQSPATSDYLGGRRSSAAPKDARVRTVITFGFVGPR